MAAKRFLLVHPEADLRHDISDFLQNAIPGSLVIESDSLTDAKNRLDDAPFDAIIADRGPQGKDGEEISRIVTYSSRNPESPVLLLNLTSNTDNIEQLHWILRQGIETLLGIPFRATSLPQRVIDKKQKPARRFSPRVDVDNVKVVLTAAQRVFDADVVNLSLDGILCDLVYPGAVLHALQYVKMTIHLPQPYKNETLNNISASLIRMNTREWAEGSELSGLRVAWAFSDLSPAGRRALWSYLNAVQMNTQPQPRHFREARRMQVIQRGRLRDKIYENDDDDIF